MKILHVCPLYAPSLGGNQYHMQLLSEGLARLGHEVHVFTANVADRRHFKIRPDIGETLPPRELLGGCHVQRFAIDYRLSDLIDRVSRWRGGYRFCRYVFGNADGYWSEGPLTLGLAGAIKALRPEVVLADMDNSFTTYQCYRACRQEEIPFVLMPVVHRVEDKPYHRFAPVIYRAADCVVACTAFEKRELISRGVPGEKIHVIAMGMSGDFDPLPDRVAARRRLGLDPDALVVSYIGRKSGGKGIEALVRAMTRVWRESPEVQLVLAGQLQGGYAGEYRRLLEAVPVALQKNVHDIDSFAEEDKTAVYAASDVMAAVSQMDCFGFMYLEAWACGVPVIASTDSPQACFIDDGVNGRLVDYDDDRALAGVILDLSANRSACQTMGARGRDTWSKKYTAEHMTRAFEELYKKGTDSSAPLRGGQRSLSPFGDPP